jgi:hypothetical protein
MDLCLSEMLQVLLKTPWSQLSGAVAGGLFGAFSGFLVNVLQRRAMAREQAKSIGFALAGEIGALSELIRDRYLAMLESGEIGLHGYRGEREFAQVYRSLGASIGLLPAPLPCDLVKWYTAHTICLERARELHDLALSEQQGWKELASEIVAEQKEDIRELLQGGPDLMKRLTSL